MQDRFLRLRGLSQCAPNDGQESGIVHRFLQKGLRSRFESALSVYAKVASGDNDDGSYSKSGNRFEPFHDDVTIATGQTEIEEH